MTKGGDLRASVAPEDDSNNNKNKAEHDKRKGRRK